MWSRCLPHYLFVVRNESFVPLIIFLVFLQTCFQQRVQAFKDWQSAESTLQKKRENDAKVKALGKSEKFAQSEQVLFFY